MNRPISCRIILAGLSLVLGANVRAASVPKKEFKPELQRSTYEPGKTRDPFAKNVEEMPVTAPAPVRVVVVETMAFRLEGILHDSADPAAVINDKLVRLNKTVTLTSAGGGLRSNWSRSAAAGS